MRTRVGPGFAPTPKRDPISTEEFDMFGGKKKTTPQTLRNSQTSFGLEVRTAAPWAFWIRLKGRGSALETASERGASLQL